MRRLLALALTLIAIIGTPEPAASEQPSIVKANAGHYEGKDRLVLSITQNVTYKVFTLDRPDRLVIDLPPVQWKVGKPPLTVLPDNTSATRIRYGTYRSDASRVVLDLNQPVTLVDTFTLPPDASDAHYRLVVDMHHTAQPSTTPSPKPQPTMAIPIPSQKPKLSSNKRLPIITIDPGHGGMDPGTIGTRGTYEKKVTLRYAKALQRALAATGRYQPMLTRSDDRFLKLRERVRIGRNNQSDLFISLHADSAGNKKARGVSVYTLSEKASDKEAALLAAQENKADILADIDLSTEDKDVAEILIDLAQRETKNTSAHFAEIIAVEMEKSVKLVSNSHRFAGFAVLKAPDIPSVLVEIGFLSNRKDEDAINSKDYQQKVIDAMVRAIDRYFAEERER